MGTDFSVFTKLAHAELVEHALAVVLKDDAELTSFFGTSIYVVPEPFTFPDRPLPLLTVCSISDNELLRLNNETETTLQVALGGFYDELREVIDLTTERSVKSLLEKLRRVVSSNWRLENTSVSTPALVDRVLQFENLPFPPLPEGEEGNAIFNFQLIVTYEYSLDVLTGLKA